MQFNVVDYPGIFRVGSSTSDGGVPCEGDPNSTRPDGENWCYCDAGYVTNYRANKYHVNSIGSDSCQPEADVAVQQCGDDANSERIEGWCECKPGFLTQKRATKYHSGQIGNDSCEAEASVEVQPCGSDENSEMVGYWCECKGGFVTKKDRASKYHDGQIGTDACVLPSEADPVVEAAAPEAAAPEASEEEEEELEDDECADFWEVYTDGKCAASGGAIAIYVVIGLAVMALIAGAIYFFTRTDTGKGVRKRLTRKPSSGASTGLQGVSNGGGAQMP